MTVKQALDEINATPEQKKNGLDRLINEAKPAVDFKRQIKRYVATAAAAVITVGTAAVGVHFAMLNNQGGPISVSIGDNSAADKTVIPAENTRVHSEKSGMTFVDDNAFWAQLGKITYHPVDNTPTIDTAQINVADDLTVFSARISRFRARCLICSIMQLTSQTNILFFPTVMRQSAYHRI